MEREPNHSKYLIPPEEIVAIALIKAANSGGFNTSLAQEIYNKLPEGELRTVLGELLNKDKNNSKLK